MPERDKSENEDAREEDVSRPPKRDVDVSIETLGDLAN